MNMEKIEALVVEACRAAREEGREEIRALLRNALSDGAEANLPVAPPSVAVWHGLEYVCTTEVPPPARKNGWAGLSDEAYLKRVNAIRKGRHMKPLTAKQRREKVAERRK